MYNLLEAQLEAAGWKVNVKGSSKSVSNEK